MGCTRSRGSRGFQCLASLPRPGEPGRYAISIREAIGWRRFALGAEEEEGASTVLEGRLHALFAMAPEH